MSTIKKLLTKYKSIVMYGIFGVLTTLLNIITYAVCYKYIGMPNVVSNIIAWVLSVLFAFITNKIFVFESKSMTPKVLLMELVKFVVARLATGILDVAIMYVFVDVMEGPAVVFKVIANVIVIVLNYVLSKVVVFEKRENI